MRDTRPQLQHADPDGLVARLTGAGIPFIFCTASSTKEVVEHFRGARVLEKPFEDAALVSIVMGAIKLGALEEDLTPLEPPKRRAAYQDVTERRASLDLVKDHFADIAAWQSRSVRLRSLVSLSHSSEEDRLAARTELAEIQGLVLIAIQDVTLASGGAPAAGSVRDVLVSLGRLDGQLREALGRPPTNSERAKDVVRAT